MAAMSEASRPIDRRRYRRITRFFGGVVLHLIWWEGLVARLMPQRVRSSRQRRYRRLARRFRELAVEMGGVMIKAGQFLSARVDILPPYITDELAELQDEVPPEPYEAISAVIAAELGAPPEELFAWLEREPQAAASLGQTHRARLREGDGTTVIVKVQRPGIRQLVETDLAALRTVARWLMLYPPIRRRADVPALVDELARSTWEELDYLAEADHAERFAELFADDPGVRIPAVHRSLTTRRVLTLEDVEQIKITDFAAIEAAGICRAEVARKVFDVYLRQIFEEGYFHADPHPGNLFLRPAGSAGSDGRPFELIFVDFGMVGRITPEVSEQLREILLAVALRDARRMVRAYQRLDFLLPGADPEPVERATVRLLDRFWGMSVTDITHVDPAELGALVLEFRDLLLHLPFQVPQDFILLGRAVSMLTGLATSLDPDFDPWTPIELYAARLLADGRRWPRLREGLELAGGALQALLLLPGRLERVLRQVEEEQLEVRLAPDSGLQRDLRRVERAADRLLWGVVFGALLVGGALLYTDGATALGVTSWLLGGLALLWGLLGRGR